MLELVRLGMNMRHAALLNERAHALGREMAGICTMLGQELTTHANYLLQHTNFRFLHDLNYLISYQLESTSGTSHN